MSAALAAALTATNAALHRQHQDLCAVQSALERARAAMPRDCNPGGTLDDWDTDVETALRKVERAINVLCEKETTNA